MKINSKIVSILFALVLSHLLVIAQENRTTKTKVADILATLPANDHQEAKKMCDDLIALGDDAMLMVANGVRPNGIEEGIPFRYGISLMSHYTANPGQKSKVANMLIKAIDQAENTEVKAYFINNLGLVGSDESIAALSEFIKDEVLFNDAIAALELIGSPPCGAVLLKAMNDSPPATYPRIVKALGKMKYEPALETITKHSLSQEAQLRKQALWSMAHIAHPTSYGMLLEQAKAADFKNDDSNRTTALVEYMNQLAANGQQDIASEIASKILLNAIESTQQQFRLAALRVLAQINPDNVVQVLSPELNRFDHEYRKEILNIAADHPTEVTAMNEWNKIYQRLHGQERAELLTMMAKAGHDETLMRSILTDAIASKDIEVRKAAANSMAATRDKKYANALLGYLIQSSDTTEIETATSGLLQLADDEILRSIATLVRNAGTDSKIGFRNTVALLGILSARRATGYFDVVLEATRSTHAEVRNAALKALPNVSSLKDVPTLLTRLVETNDENEIRSTQKAIIAAQDASVHAAIHSAYQVHKIKTLPLLAYVADADALKNVQIDFEKGNGQLQETAFAALTNWQNHTAANALLAIRKNQDAQKYHERASEAFVAQISSSSLPDEQKLHMLRQLMDVAVTQKEKIAILRAAGRLRGNAPLTFVTSYLDDVALGGVASRATMQIALPTSDARPGLTGTEVRSSLIKALNKLTGPDSQYDRIDIETYLAQLADTSPVELTEEERTQGFEMLFNGKNLDHWQGNKTEYIVENNVIAVRPSDAESHGNLYTKKEYSDFMLRFEFQLTPAANNGLGIHTPLEGDAAYVGKEIQILDNSAAVYANLEPWQYHGSVYGIMAAKRSALKPVGEWNAEEVYVKGDYIKVTLNGTVILEGDLKKATKNGTLDKKDHPGLKRHSGHIAFLGHGSVVKFRNIRIRDLSKK